MFKHVRRLTKLSAHKKSYAAINAHTFPALNKAKQAMADYNLPKREQVRFQSVR